MIDRITRSCQKPLRNLLKPFIKYALSKTYVIYPGMQIILNKIE